MKITDAMVAECLCCMREDFCEPCPYCTNIVCLACLPGHKERCKEPIETLRKAIRAEAKEKKDG